MRCKNDVIAEDRQNLNQILAPRARTANVYFIHP